MDGAILKATAAGTVLQTVMVVVGHFVPALAEAGLFPIAGTLIGLVTGWLAGAGRTRATAGVTAVNGGVAGGVAGVLGSLVSTALGDVPLSNVAIAGGSTFVTGAIGAYVRWRRAGKSA